MLSSQNEFQVFIDAKKKCDPKRIDFIIRIKYTRQRGKKTSKKYWTDMTVIEIYQQFFQENLTPMKKSFFSIIFSIFRKILE